MPFSYFGSKRKLVKLYKPPLYDLIIEPFAGSAQYAIRYGLDREVWINDKYPVIYEIWKWIQNATRADIRALPDLTHIGETLLEEKYKYLSKVERDLLGFAVGQGSSSPQYAVSPFAANTEHRGIPALKKRLIRLAGKIKHWKITCIDYFDIPNQEACWFIDPPYELYGKYYKFKEIDYPFLGEWCKTRRGQVTVCEAGEAAWLPFRPLREVKRTNAKGRVIETVWYRSDRKLGFGLF